jgi:hypothetical protein
MTNDTKRHNFLPDGAIAKACTDSDRRWAAAFCQANGGDLHMLEKWFSAVIEAAKDAHGRYLAPVRDAEMKAAFERGHRSARLAELGDALHVAVNEIMEHNVSTLGLDGIARPGTAVDTTDCPSSECQIRRMCTRPGSVGCRKPVTDGGVSVVMFERNGGPWVRFQNGDEMPMAWMMPTGPRACFATAKSAYDQAPNPRFADLNRAAAALAGHPDPMPLLEQMGEPRRDGERVRLDEELARHASNVIDPATLNPRESVRNASGEVAGYRVPSPMCCAIGCAKPATWGAIAENAPPTPDNIGETHACDDHLVEIGLTTISGHPESNYWRVWVIGVESPPHGIAIDKVETTGPDSCTVTGTMRSTAPDCAAGIFERDGDLFIRTPGGHDVKLAAGGPSPAGPWCENCGDAFTGPKRDCPKPAKGRPYKECGRGGHMFRLEHDPALGLDAELRAGAAEIFAAEQTPGEFRLHLARRMLALAGDRAYEGDHEGACACVEAYRTLVVIEGPETR